MISLFNVLKYIFKETGKTKLHIIAIILLKIVLNNHTFSKYSITMMTK